VEPTLKKLRVVLTLTTTKATSTIHGRAGPSHTYGSSRTRSKPSCEESQEVPAIHPVDQTRRQPTSR
jgi:hypothetical protein